MKTHSLLLALIALPALLFYSRGDDETRASSRPRGSTERQRPGPGAAEGEVVVFDLKLTLVRIEPGSFMMGSPAGETGRHRNERRHKVTLTKPYWIGATEVTQAQYEALTGENPSNFRGDSRPVEQVSWHDAVAFCRKLTERERRAGRLPEGQVYRLPTEAEWEYACRAGSETAYSFGDDADGLDRYAWYYENSGDVRLEDSSWTHVKSKNSRCRTHEVARKAANPWGLYDVHGNVSEWCSDWYGPYPRSAVTDPTGPAKGSSRVHRNGCWGSVAVQCRSAFRSDSCGPSNGWVWIGFRLARGAPISAVPSKNSNGDENDGSQAESDRETPE